MFNVNFTKAFNDITNKNLAEKINNELIKRDERVKVSVYQTLLTQLKEGEFESFDDLIESLEESILCATC